MIPIFLVRSKSNWVWSARGMFEYLDDVVERDRVEDLHDVLAARRHLEQVHFDRDEAVIIDIILESLEIRSNPAAGMIKQ